MTLSSKHLPSEGEVWAAPQYFTWRMDKDGTRTENLNVYAVKNADGIPVWDVDGYEIRKIVSVITVPNHQRYVVYQRHFAPDGRPPFGKRSLRITPLSAFTRWRKGTLKKTSRPATRIEPSTVEKAIKILEAA